MSKTRQLKKIGFVYLVREMSEGNIYIPVKKKIMRVRNSCFAIIFEIDRFVIYFYFLKEMKIPYASSETGWGTLSKSMAGYGGGKQKIALPLRTPQSY